RLLALIGKFSQISGFGARLAGMRSPPPAGYTDDEWEIVRAAFRVLRQAAAELRIVFAEAGVFDFTEVAQMAGRVLRDADGLPTEAALGIADGIRHLLIDEFQDTSRRQHQLLADLVAAWPDRNGRSVFVVGDPAQSIYSFRDADAELFPRVRQYGLEIRGEQPLQFDFAQLSANFRTEPSLVTSLNEAFDAIFAVPDGSGIEFAPSQPARPSVSHASPRFNSHFMFMPALKRGKTSGALTTQARSAARVARDATFRAQTGGIIDIVRSHLDRMEQARACGQKYRIAVLARVGKSLDPIALALREAAIPFRAVELEHLRDRPEILDALALARALLNPLDRVAWLGVLRAPWCGLSLNDLHVLTSSDDSGLLARPIPELLTGRRHLLSVEGRVAVLRLCQVLQSVPALQSVLPTASLGTRLSQIWLMLGGAACVDAASAANLELLWSSLDSLSGGEQDLIGPALDAALKQLTALPGPGAESDCGVQLMTIHKSKGLEFEVVIVPDLQVRGGSGNQDMLSWLERGITKPDSPGDEITEFLVAPIQPRGSDRGIAKAWVDEILRERDDQEARRIFYVAATRARDELHLLACIAYSDAEDEVELTPPSRTLLATAWPALHAEAQTQFSRWWSTSVDHSGVLKDLAALEGALITMPTPPGSAIIRRLPADFQPPTALPGPPSAAPAVVGSQDLWLYERHQGGLLSRSLGTAVHTLLEALTTLLISHDWDDARASLPHLVPRITGQIRASGVPAPQAKSLAAQALDIALAASRDVHGQWILSPHADAGSEAAWTGVLAGQVHAVRVDRVFRAAHAPLAEGEDTWWIIDYKTAHEDGLDPSDALPRLRSLFAPQLEIYAAILRNLHGAQAPIHAGLYYPRMAQFDWWQAG
ncbi:MAG TPA: 3'-5' exonuclease, partial [Terracidiphilus sp.]|nr:3'-5' exonuclease [Terracidiphilus sp.]